MVAKGLHFPEVTLVGVLNSDQSLHIPDFRASENLFQLLTQVSGRAGRAETAGLVLIQTLLPDNPLLHLAASQDYVTFAQNELVSRQLLSFPPFTRMTRLLFSGKEAALTRKTASHFCARLGSLLPKAYTLFPLIPCHTSKIKDHYQFHCLIKGPSNSPLAKTLQSLLDSSPLPKSIRLRIDIDPLRTT